MGAGLIALLAALVVATAAGFVLRGSGRRFRRAASNDGKRGGSVLTEEDLGQPLGARATLVQFSTAFCAPCHPTRQILSQVADTVPGVRHVDIDATSRLDLVERLRIFSTPTVLVLDQAGVIAQRASGQPRKVDVIAALGRVIQARGDSRAESE
ncbi:MAG TPA: thioredoxin family protein [Streptosporangiaceae bacterium]|nr:thioredoxin family protein [Streptosporangiaceae bacterium]